MATELAEPSLAKKLRENTQGWVLSATTGISLLFHRNMTKNALS